jgi:hypothetical protein
VITAEEADCILAGDASPVHKCDDDSWWFWDETWAFRHGPFATRWQAERALQRYAALLTSTPKGV